MKSNRIFGAGGIVLLAAFAIGTSAQASTLSGVPLSTDGSLSMAGTQSLITESGSGFIVPDLSFDACDDNSCSETEDAGVATTSGGVAAGPVSFSLVAAPEPASFVLVGLTLAVLPLIRKKRS